jgi:hypothetical protein
MFVVCGGITGLVLVDALVNASIQVGTFVFPVVFGIFALAGLVFFVGGIIRFIVGGEWNIEMTDKELVWDTPPVAEHSFQMKIADMAFIEKAVKRKERSDGTTKQKIRYYLESIDGARRYLESQSGVDIEQIINCLESLGVEVRERSLN